MMKKVKEKEETVPSKIRAARSSLIKWLEEHPTIKGFFAWDDDAVQLTFQRKSQELRKAYSPQDVLTEEQVESITSFVQKLIVKLKLKLQSVLHNNMEFIFNLVIGQTQS